MRLQLKVEKLKNPPFLNFTQSPTGSFLDKTHYKA